MPGTAPIYFALAFIHVNSMYHDVLLFYSYYWKSCLLLHSGRKYISQIATSLAFKLRLSHIYSDCYFFSTIARFLLFNVLGGADVVFSSFHPFSFLNVICYFANPIWEDIALWHYARHCPYIFINKCQHNGFNVPVPGNHQWLILPSQNLV